MAYWHYDRLSALDAMFLDIEDANVHMHVGAVALFEAGPLRQDGELAVDRIRATVTSALSQSPRFRQKLVRVPLVEHPVWVDDDRFNLDYHVRHTSLPRPGSPRRLKRLAARILSQKLDRGKPLWEMWIVEGIEGERVALIVKAHHCMVDGISGLDLLTAMLRLDRDSSVEEPRPWYPRPRPSGARLLTNELARRAGFPLTALRSASNWRQSLGHAQEMLTGFGEVLAAGLRPTSGTPLNPEIGPYRRFDWTRVDLESVREIRSRLGGTLNDVVLACAAGAIGGFLRQRGLPIDDLVFRAQVPVSIRTGAERGLAGNRVAMLLAELPIAERDPRGRLARVVETTRRLKRSRQRAGVEFLEELSDRTLPSLWSLFARFATWQRSYNVVVTNIPGPQCAVYLLGARMLEIYPLVPLAYNQAVGIALFSFDGGLFWGFHADWDVVPDLHDLVRRVDVEVERLRKCAAQAAEEPT